MGRLHGPSYPKKRRPRFAGSPFLGMFSVASADSRRLRILFERLALPVNAQASEGQTRQERLTGATRMGNILISGGWIGSNVRRPLLTAHNRVLRG